MADKVLAAAPKLAQQVLDGKITIHRAKLQIERKELKRRALRRAKQLGHAPDQPMPIFGKAQDHIRELEDGSVQVLLTDPPYGIRYLGSSADPEERGVMASDDPKDAPSLLREVLELLAPKFAPEAHFYIFCPARSDLIFDVIKEFFHERFNVVVETLIWLKAWSGPGGTGFAPVYERIAHGRLGSPARPLSGLRMPDVIPMPPPSRRGKHTGIHKTQKPYELLQLLVLKSSEVGERVVDPFAGSGSTLRAARMLGRQYWGTECGRNYRRQAVDHVENALVVMDDTDSTYESILYAQWRDRQLVGWRRHKDGSVEPTSATNPLFAAPGQR
ncbi:MAG: DNA-methyltransferase, partial [bacterium]